ncbi:MAG: hypothetical protein ABI537_07880 [Casimicrobiaceae bacterium]
MTEIARSVTHAEYVEAFYTTALFKAERALLAWFIAKPSTDLEAREVARGTINSFAAWRVEARAADQVLLSDFQGRTRSWLMLVPAATNASASTRLYFGSAVVPVANGRSAKSRMGIASRALLGFHKLYSRMLLRAAVGRLERSSGAG